MTRTLPADLQAAAALGGEMGTRLASFDWSAHPLGDPSHWSAAIRSAVANALPSRFPIVLWLGNRLRLIYNDAYIPMLGDKHPAAFGAAGAEVWWDVWDVVGPLMDGVVASGQATWSDDLKLMLVNDGRRAERYFTFTYSPIIGADGDMEGVFCAVTETTERVLSERRLQALNALAAALLDTQSVDDALAAAIDVCAAHDADMPFAAVYAGGGPGSASLRAATPRAAGALPISLAALLDGELPNSYGLSIARELPARLPALADRLGEECPHQAVVVPIADATDSSSPSVLALGINRFRPLDQQYTGFCRLVADQLAAAVTSARAYENERRRAESLAELDRAKTVFLTNISHEFRTPLTLMLGPIDDALAAAAADEVQTERLQTVQRNGRRLLRLVNALLDFSRIEAGQTSPQLAPTDIGALTTGVASSFADVCKQAGINLDLECEPAWAAVDPDMWETIVVNLVSNAFKHTLTGSIRVATVMRADGVVELTVADTGTGIAAEDLPRMFDRFYRIAGNTGRSAEGSGIGLALVRSLVEMHDGSIQAESVPGEGTTLTIRVPTAVISAPVSAPGGDRPPGTAGSAYAEEVRQWLELDMPGPEPARAARPLLLVADDNADMRRHLTRILQDRWDVMTAADGRQALTLARQHQPDLVIADVMMPVMDGFALVEAIRTDLALAALPVIMLSARAGPEATGEGLAAGADQYLMKPFSSGDLVRQVAARLGAAARDRSAAMQDDLAARRDLALAELGTALGGAASVGQVLDLLAESPLCALGATAVAVGLLDDGAAADGGKLRIFYAGSMPAELTDRYHLVNLDAAVPLADAARTGERIVVPDTSGLGHRYRQFVADTSPVIQAAVTEPLRAGDGTVLGALSLAWASPRDFTPPDLDVLERVAALTARAITRIMVAEREHQIAMSLQERLLDLGAQPATAAVSAAYQPAGEVMRVGGDWYTATPVGPTRIGVSVGDVVGHGLQAATVMSQLRSALGAAALSTADPAAVVALLDRYARTVPDAAFATVAYAVVDTAAGTVDYACAGHPYPLIVGADGSVTWLRDGRQQPLAARSFPASATSGHAALAVGALLVLYTDGLIERRAETLDAGLDRLASAASRCARLPADAACAALLAEMAGPDSYADDVAIIALRPVGTAGSSHVDVVPATLAELSGARRRLRGWLDGLAVDRAAIHRVLVSVGEALTNAIEHGSGLDASRTVSIQAFAEPDAISASVTDSGRWRQDSAASRAWQRGRGLRLIHGLSDNVQTVRTLLGTRVTMTYSLDRLDDSGR